MSKAPPPRGGVAGLALLFCFTAAAIGLAFDYSAGDAAAFWVGARPGGAAAIGAAGAVFCVAAGRIVGALLGRSGAEGSADADADA